MKNRDDKEKDLEDLKKTVAENANIFVTSYEKMTVSQDYQLRKTIREAGGNYKVVKNNLAELAAEGTAAVNLLSGLKGMTSLAYTSKDPVTLAKALTKYSKENAQFTFKAGLVEGRVIDIKAMNDLATMPPKEEIYAKMLFLINATATRLVSSINGVGRNLAVVLNQGVEQNKFQQ
ncbi:MAG TPA: 50S ribosomal protein L10 [Bryobacteraceae bacterium]|jgi:large subunit ribosomal protein L10